MGFIFGKYFQFSIFNSYLHFKQQKYHIIFILFSIFKRFISKSKNNKNLFSQFHIQPFEIRK